MYQVVSPPITTPTEIITIEQLGRITTLLSRESYLGFDMEATGKDPRKSKPIAMQFGTPKKSWILDCRPYQQADPIKKKYWRKAIQDFLYSGPVMVGHNLKYDWQLLFTQFGCQLDDTKDTMLQEQVIHSLGFGRGSMRVNLLTTAERYDIFVHKEEVSWFVDLDKPRKFYESGHYSFEADGKEQWFNAYGKPEKPLHPGEVVEISDRLWYEPFPPAQIDYMHQDVVVPLAIANVQQKKLMQLGLLPTAQLENEVLPAFAYKEVCGFFVDRERWEEIIEVRSIEEQKIRAELQEELSGYLQAARQKRYDEGCIVYNAWREERDALDQVLELDYLAKKEAGTLPVGEPTIVPMPMRVYFTQLMNAWLEQYPRPDKRKQPGQRSEWDEMRNEADASIRQEYEEKKASGTLPPYEEPGKIQTLAQYLKVAREPWLEEHPEPWRPTPSDERKIQQPINLGAWQQLLEVFHARGIPLTGTSEEVLKEYKDIPAIVKLLKWKELNKFLTTYGYRLLDKIEEDGRFHTTFLQIGAETGRVASRDPNLQNVDSTIHNCFIAPRGRKLCTADFSNIELRILADVSGDVAMLEAFASGKDLHCETARMMFGITYSDDELKGDEKRGIKPLEFAPGVTYRQSAKKIGFGLMYGQGASGLAGELRCSLELAEELLTKYRELYTTATTFLYQQGILALQERIPGIGFTETSLGRKRFFELPKKPYRPDEMSWEEYKQTPEYVQFKEKQGYIQREGKNHTIQGTSADMTKKALYYLYHELPAECYIVASVHDELVIESPDELVDVCVKKMQDCMMRACRDFLKKVEVPAIKVSVSQYWSK